MKDIRCLVISAVILMMSGVYVSALEVDDFTFRHLSHADGLCSQRIYSISQTCDGAIWWAAKNCVERYDGVDVKCYKFVTPDSFGYLAGRYIKLFHSSSDRLYAFDNKGCIFVYDSFSDSFLLVANVNDEIGSQKILNDIFVDDEEIWLASGDGIYLFSDGHVEALAAGFSANDIVEVDRRLMFCSSDGLFECRKGGRDILKMKEIGSHNIVSGYYDGQNGRLWIGCFTCGIEVISFANNGKIKSVDDVFSPLVPLQNPVRCITPYDENTMLLGIDGGGVFQASRHPDSSGKHEVSVLLDANNGRHGVLHGNGVYSMICDSWGNIIVGSYSGGIDIACPVGMASKLFRHQYNNLQSILNDHVNCVAQIPSGELAMGTDNGVSIYDPEDGSWMHACNGSVVIDLCMLSSGSLLVGTYGNGVMEVFMDGSSRQKYSVSGGILKDDHVYRIVEDADGGLWMGCLDGPLVYLKDGVPEYYGINNVKDVLQISDSRIIVGSVTGIFCIDKNDRSVSELEYSIPGIRDVSKYVCTLHLSDDGKLWLGTDGGGIYIYDPATEECRQISVADGLPSNTVSSICEDSFGRIVISTDYGLSYIDKDYPDRVVNVNYGYDVDREYVGRAMTKLSDGSILYGTTSGALVINPENLRELDYEADLNIRGFRCMASDDASADDMNQMLRQGTINLKYAQRTFELYFECINLPNQNDISYSYKLGDGEWSAPVSIQFIRFNNLEPGRHVLHMRSVSRSCGTVIDEETLEIYIAGPWWTSWWMVCLYVLLLVFAFYVFWYFYQLHTQYMRIVVNNPNLISVTLPGQRLVENIRSRSNRNDDGQEFVDKTTSLIVRYLSDSEFNIDRLCHEMAMSRTMFYLKLKAYTGKSPQDFIRVIRLERAAALLRAGKAVAEVADMVGFDNPKYFSTVFKKYFGVSPSKYR